MTARKSLALLLIVAAAGALAGLLWSDGGQAQRVRRDHALVIAVQEDNLAGAAHLLGEGADPNAQTPPTSLSQKLHYYQRMMSGGMRVSPLGHLGDRGPHYSVLEIAAMRGDPETVRLLLSKGADASYKDRTNRTAHDWALAVGSPFGNGPVEGRDYARVITLLKAARKKAPNPH